MFLNSIYNKYCFILVFGIIGLLCLWRYNTSNFYSGRFSFKQPAGLNNAIPYIEPFGSSSSDTDEAKLSFDFEFPDYWKTLLKPSEALQFVLLDGAALKCIHAKVKKQKQTCHALAVNMGVRLGTRATNFTRFKKLLKKHVLKDRHFKILGHLVNEQNVSDTVILKFTNDNNFDRFIFITFLNATGEEKNYYLLKGNDIIPDLGIRKFGSESLHLVNLGVHIDVPDDVDLYFQYYDNGRFVSCNKELAAHLRDDTEERSIPIGAVNTLSVFADDLLKKTGQMAFLACGTLLGWYRECGIIPHTTDLDLYVFSTQYPDGFEETFRTEHYQPSRRIGIKEYGFELTFWLNHKIDGFSASSVDIFYVFDHNSTTQWTSAISNFEKMNRFRFLVPKVHQLCSADLYGQLFFVPCNFMHVITTNYGPRWNQSYSAGWTEHGMQVLEDDFWHGNQSEIIHYFT